ATGVAEELEEVVPLSDGTRRVWASRKVPYLDAEGRVIGLLGVSRDITGRKEAEEALAGARDELAVHAATLEQTVADRTGELSETVEELEAFSYSLSHDMRAPLRAMKGFSQILEAQYAECLGPQGALYVGRISRAAGRLDQLIQDVLTYSRVAREKIELRPVDVERLLHQLVDENPALHPPQAHVSVIGPLEPVHAHEAYLMQVLSNLVYNAVKFAKAGEPARVRIWSEGTDTHVRVVVEDDGIGIPADAQARVFRMFERVHADRVYEGTGIGLTIVRKAIERMGGEVGLESELGRGSRFWFRLARVRVG
ncbi:MAG: sensor histidine kinase, partial [Myxococcota bacterium]